MKTATTATKETFITPREVAVRRGVTLAYVYHLLWANRLPGARKVDGNWRIPLAALTRCSSTTSSTGRTGRIKMTDVH